MAIRGRASWYALFSGAAFLAVDAAYVGLLQSQGTLPLSDSALVFEVLLLALATSAVVAAVVGRQKAVRLARTPFANHSSLT